MRFARVIISVCNLHTAASPLIYIRASYSAGPLYCFQAIFGIHGIQRHDK